MLKNIREIIKTNVSQETTYMLFEKVFTSIVVLGGVYHIVLFGVLVRYFSYTLFALAPT